MSRPSRDHEEIRAVSIYPAKCALPGEAQIGQSQAKIRRGRPNDCDNGLVGRTPLNRVQFQKGPSASALMRCRQPAAALVLAQSETRLFPFRVAIKIDPNAARLRSKDPSRATSLRNCGPAARRA